MISEGKHKAVCQDIEFGFTDSGTEQVAISFRISDGEHEGEFITAYRYFTDRAAEYAFKDLEALGWEGDSLESAPEDCPGSECTLVIEHEEYDGKERARVKFINVGSGGLKNVFEGKKRSDFFERMKRKHKALSGSTKKEEKEVPFEKKS